MEGTSTGGDFMKRAITFFLTFFIFAWMAADALACSPSVQGLSPKQMIQMFSELEEAILTGGLPQENLKQKFDEEKSKRYTTIEIEFSPPSNFEFLWNNVEVELGLLNDCDAIKVKAKAMIIMDIAGSKCLYETYINYTRKHPSTFLAITRDRFVFCD